MLKKVQGFVTSDNSFFEDEVDAELHEATADLDHVVEELQYSPTQFREIIDETMHYVRRYIDARSKVETVIHHEDEHQGQADTAPLFDESADRRKPVRSLGSGSRTKKVSNE